MIAACLQRFRPIMLATFTTVLGLLPLYLSGGEMWEGMAVFYYDRTVVWYHYYLIVYSFVLQHSI